MASRNFTRGRSAGFNSTTEAQVNTELRVKVLNKKGLTLQFRALGTEPLTTLTHTWFDTPDGLMVRSQFWIGNAGFGKILNRLINCQFSRGEDPLVVANKWQQHNVQEFGK